MGSSGLKIVWVSKLKRIEELFLIHFDSFKNPKQWDEYIEFARNPDNHIQAVVCKTDENFRASLCYSVTGGDFHIFDLTVVPDRRRRSVGSFAVNYLKQELRRAISPRKKIIVDVPESALETACPFFRKHRFTATGLLKNFINDREDAVRMVFSFPEEEIMDDWPDLEEETGYYESKRRVLMHS